MQLIRREKRSVVWSRLRRSGVIALVFAGVCGGCGGKNLVNPKLSETMPPKFLWAWERPENLTFLDPRNFGVAFLAQTLTLSRDTILPRPRRQPLELSPGSYVIAVTRIETVKEVGKQPLYSLEQRSKIIDLVLRTLELPDVRAVQIDFDVVGSERQFYRSLLQDLRVKLPDKFPLSITSLASWCAGDNWFNDCPIDEAVPMAFRMGADNDKIRRFLKDANDWNEPLCRGSYGVSIDEPLDMEFKPGRQIYYFKDTSWTKADLTRIRP